MRRFLPLLFIGPIFAFLCLPIYGIQSTASISPANSGTFDSSLLEIEKALDSGSFSQARKLAEELVRSHPDNFKARLMSGRVFKETGLWSLALLEYEKALKLNPSEPEPYLSLSQMYLDNLNSERALQLASEAVRLAPQSKQARLCYVSALLADYNLVEAKREFQRLKQDFPSDPDVLYLSYRVHKESGQLLIAGQSLEMALRMRPANLPWLFELSEIYQSLKEYSMARDAMLTYIKAAPDSVVARLKLAEILEFGLEDLSGARKAFNGALTLDPDSPTALLGLERLERKELDGAYAIRRAVRSFFSWIFNRQK